MALFSLTDINFNRGARNLTGQNTELFDSSFKYDIMRYPSDIGNYDKGHYMVIHINVQDKTNVPYREVTGDEPQYVTDRLNSGTNAVGQGLANAVGAASSLVDKALNYFGINNVNVNRIGAELQNSLEKPSFIRAGKRTTETIALYMPDTLQFTQQQNFSEVSLGGGLGGALLTGATSLSDTLKKFQGKDAVVDSIKNLSPIFGSLLANQAGDIGRVLFTSVVGAVQNPMMEVLYSSPSFRTFRFDFMFYPRDRKEAENVQKILKSLQLHQAPEIFEGSGGFLLVPPSEFDIKFYYNGKENPNIPKISTCVLSSLDIDYAPNGFSAYEMPNDLNPSEGGTGMPVAIRLSLEFKETLILTKEYYLGKAPEGTVTVGPLIDENTEEVNRISQRDPNNIV